MKLDASNGDVEVIDFDGNAGFDIFGDISNVLDPGEDTLNGYRAADGGLQPGDSWDEFSCSNGPPTSQLFVVLQGIDRTIYGSGVTPLPEPGAALLLVRGLAALAARRSRLD